MRFDTRLSGSSACLRCCGLCTLHRAASRVSVGALAISILLICLCQGATHAANDTRQEHGEDRRTDLGLYRLVLTPVPDQIPLGELHNWTVAIVSADGTPVEARQLVINGGMPGHGHGFPSNPQFTRYLGDGTYLIEGMKFNMPGRWQIVIGVTGPSGPDEATFEWDVLASPGEAPAPPEGWSTAQIGLIRSLWIGSLGGPPRDGSNRFSGHAAAVDVGRQLYFDKALSSTGTVACSSCHDPARYFTDGQRVSRGTGLTARNAPTLLGVSYHKWFYWDGRRDSLWAQAVTPMESVGEMENTRVNVARYVAGSDNYANAFRRLGAPLADFRDDARFPAAAGPYAKAEGKAAWYRMRAEDRDAVNRAFSDTGKMIAAYVESLQHAPSRFDNFAEALVTGQFQTAAEMLTGEEEAGLRLFLDIGRTHCLRCHNGPLFTNFGFHNVATAVDLNGIPDFGRMTGLQAAMVDEFNCRGKYSDERSNQCAEVRFAAEEHNSIGAFKVPGLRDVARTAPYLHDGRFSSLEEVLRFYMQKPAPDLEPHEILPLTLTDTEVEQMIAFLHTLNGLSPPL